MTERPILFSGPLVRAILAGEKTETRRLVTKSTSRMVAETRAAWDDLDWSAATVNRLVNRNESGLLVPGSDTITHGVAAKIRAGDTLWVRESWRVRRAWDDDKPSDLEEGETVLYDADGSVVGNTRPIRWGKGRPSIFLPRWASRITLRVTEVKVERLQEIDGRSVLAEGVDNGKSNPAMGKRWENMQRMAFARLWNEINGKRPGARWEDNPWVWVVKFQRLEPAGCGPGDRTQGDDR